MRSAILLSAIAAVAAALPSAEQPAEHQLSERADRGKYTISGYGDRKKRLFDHGGNTEDLAIAMLETDNLSGYAYHYGDDKTGDSACFGMFLDNWGVLRHCASAFKGKSESQWKDGDQLNWDYSTDIKSRHECAAHYGYSKWMAVHRLGSPAGLENPNDPRIIHYRSAVEWIHQQIKAHPQYKYDDTRIWVDVAHI